MSFLTICLQVASVDPTGGILTGIGCLVLCCCGGCSACAGCYECYYEGSCCCAQGCCCEGCARGRECCGVEENNSTNNIVLPNREPVELLQMPPTVSNNRIKTTIVPPPTLPVQEQENKRSVVYEVKTFG
jgi:hypothetical protein